MIPNLTLKKLTMDEKSKDSIVSELEVVVDQRRNELRKALDEGATNLEELTFKMLKAALILLGVYLFLEYLINKNVPKNRFTNRILPLLTMLLQSGAKIVLSDLFSKVVDHLDLKQSEKPDEETDIKK